MSIIARFEFLLEYVDDIEAAKRFFTDVLGLEVKRYHPTFVQFEHFAIASDESLGGRRAPEHYWVVQDIDRAFEDLSGQTEVVLPLTDKPFGRVFAVKDPAGEPLYLLEYARNRPSRAMP